MSPFEEKTYFSIRRLRASNVDLKAPGDGRSFNKTSPGQVRMLFRVAHFYIKFLVSDTPEL